MKLSQLITDLKSTTGLVSFNKMSDADFEINQVTSDTRNLAANTLFAAIKGTSRDGHEFLAEAVQKGVSALVVEELNKVPSAFKGSVIQVKNSREALDRLAASFYSYPSKSLFCVGVTGTNGKTSTTYMVEALLNEAGFPTGVMGTINHHLLAKIWESSMTTPDPVALQKRLREFMDDGAKAAAMEVSSHALDQKRADSVDFDVAIFTNLTRDHLDYHQTMDNYLGSKQRLFLDLFEKSGKNKKAAFINIDDPYGEGIKVHSSAQKFRIGQKNADLTFKIQKLGVMTTDFLFQTPWGQGPIQLPMSGLHNVY
ncbi:MAG: Mur ligase family protein, partial [Pseudobdellovibrionaceae bacterium]